MLQAEKKSKGRILYAENWIYAPSIQKEREIIEKTGAQVLWIHAAQLALPYHLAVLHGCLDHSRAHRIDVDMIFPNFFG